MPDEIDIIRTVTRVAGRLPPGYSKIGDDVATIPVAGRSMVVKVDMLVGKTDVPPGMTHREAARKAVAMCVSDFAAKGAKPDSFLVSMGIPRRTTDGQVRQLALGFKDASKQWGLRLIGGDTGEASDLVIDCVMVGFAQRIVRRDGARVGELVVTTGEFGYPPSGLAIMMRGANATAEYRAKAIGSVRRPNPNLEVGLALAPYLTSSMDSSDGLAICLHEIARMSRVGILLDNLPADDEVGRFARANGLSLERLVLGGGEEYLIVGTLKPGNFEKAARAAESAGGKLKAIGKVTAKESSVEMQVGQGVRRIDRIGWTHLG